MMVNIIGVYVAEKTRLEVQLEESKHEGCSARK